jgi:hypothetical protein
MRPRCRMFRCFAIPVIAIVLISLLCDHLSNALAQIIPVHDWYTLDCGIEI